MTIKPSQLVSLVEAISSVNSPIIKEEDAPAQSEFADLMRQLEASFRKYFPNGFFKATHSKRFGNSIHVRCGLIKELRDISNSIRENDPMLTDIFMHYNEAAGVFEVGSSASGLSVNPEPGSYMAMSTVKNPVRKFKTDNEAVIVKKLDQYFAKCRDIVKANWDNIYRGDQIDPKYMVEAFEESSANEVQISGKDLIDASAVVSKYPSDIRLKVIGRNKFSLSLSNKNLIDSDKLVAKLFKSLKEGAYITEAEKEVFSSDKGKVVESIKDGKQTFTAYDKSGSQLGKPFVSKSAAVTALNKSSGGEDIQESDDQDSKAGAWMDFFRMLDKVDGEFTEENPLKLGNVIFWKDRSGAFKGQWSYNLSTKDWNVDAVSKDLTRILQTNKGNE